MTPPAAPASAVTDRDAASDAASAPGALARAVPVLAVAKFLELVLGFANLVLIAAYFGDGAETAALVIAQLVPIRMGFSLRRTLNLGFIPTFKDSLVKQGEGPTWEMASSLINVCLIAFAVAALGYCLFATEWIALVAGKLSSEEQRLTVSVTRWLAPILWMFPLFAVGESILYCYGRFRSVAIATLAIDIGTGLGIVLLSPLYGIHSVAVGMLAGYAVPLVLVAYLLRRKGYQPGRLELGDPRLASVFRQVLPLLYCTSILQVGAAIDTYLATGLGVNRVSALNYAFRLLAVAPVILIQAVGMPMLTVLSERIAHGDYDRVKQIGVNYLKTVMILFTPVVLALVCLRVPLVRVAFQRGEFGPEAAGLTADAICGYAAGILGVTLNVYFHQVFFAQSRSLMVAASGTVQIIVKVALSLFLLSALDADAWIALAASVSHFVEGGLLLWICRREWGGFPLAALGRTCVKAGLAGSLMWLAMIWLRGFWQTIVPQPSFASSAVEVVVCSGAGLAVYLVCLLALRIDGSEHVLRALGRRGPGPASTPPPESGTEGT